MMKTFSGLLALFVTFSAFGFESNYGDMFFRGTPNNWRTTPMTLVADYTWEAGVTFGHSGHERFKFDAYGDWSENWGDNDNDGIGDQNGADIPAEDGSYYKVEFNDATKAYALKAQGRVYFSHQLYPSHVLAGLPIQVYTKQFNGSYDFYTSSVISYSGGTADPGSWYNFHLPVDRTFKVVLDAPTDSDRYQAEVEFTVTPAMATQNADVVTCGIDYLMIRRIPADHSKSFIDMLCEGGLWKQTVDLTPVTGTNPRAFRFAKVASEQEFYFWGDDNADGIAGEDEAQIEVPATGEYDVTMNFTTKEYTVNDRENIVTFTTDAWMPAECWLEVRGDVAPLSWYEGIAFDNKMGGQMTRTLAVAVENDANFEYKYTKACTDGSVTWEILEGNGNRQGPPTGIDVPAFP